MNTNLYRMPYALGILALFSLVFTMASCIDSIEFELPEENSQIDTELPTSSFAFTQDVIDWKKFQFQNLSAESTIFEWDFGTGETSREENPSYTFDDGEGTYIVTLKTSDANGATATSTQEVVVVEPEEPDAITPIIGEASFEDNTLEDGSGDGRDSWRNSDLGGVIQITSSPVFDGEQASKYPSAGDRIAYQELEVTPNADYECTFYYTMKTDNPGSITVDILAGGGYTSVAGAEILGSFTGTDQTDANTYVEAVLEFNSGANNTISIYIHNEGVEARLDLISVEPK